MFSEAPAFLAGVEENTKWLTRIKSKNADGVQGQKRPNGTTDYYYEGTGINKLGYGMRPLSSETAALPAHLVGTAVLMRFNTGSHFVTGQISGVAQDQGNLISQVSIKNQVMQNLMLEAAHYMTCDLFSPVSGHLATIMDIDTTNKKLKVDNIGMFRAGMKLDSYTQAGAQGLDSRTIDADPDLNGNWITMSAVTSAAIGDSLVYDDTSTYSTYGFADLLARHTNAIKKGDSVILQACNTFGNINRSTPTPGWTAFQYNHGTGTCDPKRLSDFFAKASLFHHADGGLPYTAVYANPDAFSAWLNVHEYDKRNFGSEVIYGEDNLPKIRSPYLVKPLDMVVVNGWMPYSLGFIDENDIGIRWPSEPTWLKSGGETLKYHGLDYTGYDIYTTRWGGRWCLIGHPRRHAILYGFDYLPEVSS
jgi:hypothetical protein